MSGKTILVIDDEAPIRANLLRFLRIEGYTVHEAENGTAGITSAEQLIPDLIVCDVMMPALDGFGVLTRVRANPETAKIPFIFLTASVEPDDQRFGLTLGANAYLSKPFNLFELRTLIERQLAG